MAVIIQFPHYCKKCNKKMKGIYGYIAKCKKGHWSYWDFKKQKEIYLKEVK